MATLLVQEKAPNLRRTRTDRRSGRKSACAQTEHDEFTGENEQTCAMLPIIQRKLPSRLFCLLVRTRRPIRPTQRHLAASVKLNFWPINYVA